jgi:hypothetical protein
MTIENALNGAYSFYKDPESALRSYHEFGFHVEKNFIAQDYCNALIKEADNLINAKEKTYKPVLMPHKENLFFLEAMKDAKTVEIVSQLVDGVPAGIQTQFFYCKPGTRGFSLHQDNFYIEADYGKFVSVWVALVDTSATNGGLIVYPGSHKEGHLPVRKLTLGLDPHQDRNANNEETVVPSRYVSFDMVLPKGSALFIHAHLVHGSNSNNSDHFRYSLLNLYIKNGETFRSGNSAHRELIALT